MNPLLEIRKVCKTFRIGQNPVEVLRSVEFSLQKGEFMAIMGASGSGKSTLLHILGGLEKPDSGDILVDGHKVNTVLFNEPHATTFRREQMGFVFQSFHLVASLTAEENIALPLRLAGMTHPEIKRATEEMLHVVGLYERKHNRPSQLSGGQKQRVAIARAMIHHPQLLLADEPTGNLDTKATADVMRLIETMRVRYQQTILLVTHDPMVAAHADRVLFFEDGTVRERWVNDPSSSIPNRTTWILEQLRHVTGGEQE